MSSAAAAASASKREDAGNDGNDPQQPLIDGTTIAKLLKSSGPVVKCVLLRHVGKDGRDGKPHSVPSSPKSKKEVVSVEFDDDKKIGAALAVASSKKEGEDDGSVSSAAVAAAVAAASAAVQNHHLHQKPVLEEMIEEIELDTTPGKNGVATVLGGPFTFLGQFEEEGCVVMGLRSLMIPNDAKLKKLSIHSLKAQCADFDINTAEMIEKEELVSALQQERDRLPINPHRLQPPLHHLTVRGDIVLMKVAKTDEDEDEDEGTGADDDKKKSASEGGDDTKEEEEDAAEGGGYDIAAATRSKIHVMSNEEFFQNYTKEEYVAFASRTDITAPDPPVKSDDGEEEEESDDEEEEDDDDDDDDEEGDEEEDRRAMLNLIMAEILRKFREENGRGPDTEELLEIRKQVADQLGVEVAGVPQSGDDDDDDDEAYTGAETKEEGGDDTGESKDDKKRPAQDKKADEMVSPSKRVKFSASADDAEEEEGAAKKGGEEEKNEDGQDDRKMPAK